MREHGVLVGRTGPDWHEIKIRPPMVFDTGHTERLLEAAARAANRCADGNGNFGATR